MKQFQCALHVAYFEVVAIVVNADLSDTMFSNFDMI